MEGLPKSFNSLKRPTTLVYRHQEASQFPDKDIFKARATEVRFGSPCNTAPDPEDPNGVWAFTPEESKIYMGRDDKGNERAAVVISNVSYTNKYSEGYNACLGLVGIGKNIQTGENFSFISHFDPRFICGDEDMLTQEDRHMILFVLHNRIGELIRKSGGPSNTTFEVVGGGYTNNQGFQSMYMKGISKIGDLVEEIWGMGRRPIVPLGANAELGKSSGREAGLRPSINDIPVDEKDVAVSQSQQKPILNTDVYVDTQNLGITVIRPIQRTPRWNSSFIAPRKDEWGKIIDSYPESGDGALPFSPPLDVLPDDFQRNIWKKWAEGNKE